MIMNLQRVFPTGKLRNLCLLVGWCGCMALPVSTLGAAPKSLSAHVLEVEYDDDDTVYEEADVSPMFPGGTMMLMNWLNDNVAYPDGAKTKDKVSCIEVSCIVDESGRLLSSRIKHGTDSILASEALRVVARMPRWSPALKDGKPVKKEIILPIHFIRPSKNEGTGAAISDTTALVYAAEFSEGGLMAGIDWLTAHVNYPDELKKAGIGGVVHVAFVVDEKGRVQVPGILHGVHPLLDAEVLRLVKRMPKWLPAMRDNKPVASRCVSSVHFLTGKASSADGESPKVIIVDESECPHFPGGWQAMQEWLGHHVNYPAEAKAKGIEGAVIIDFYVDGEGNIIAPKVTARVHPLLDAEAMRVVRQMPKWIPGNSDKVQGGLQRGYLIVEFPCIEKPKLDNLRIKDFE